MTDELVEQLRAVDHMSLEDCFCQSSLYDQAADRIEQLTADKRFILEERDRTFALMLARAEKAEAERDAAYARGYSDAETEISKSALGQNNDFLHSQYANAVEQIKDLNELLDDALAEWRLYSIAWMTAEGKLADAGSDIDYLHKLLAEAASDLTAYVDAEYPPDTCTQYPDIARRHYRDMELVRRIEAELKGERHD